MESLLRSLSNYYIIFIVIALIAIFAIIGYFIDKKYPKVEQKETEIDMNAVNAKSGVGLGSSLNQNNTETVEQLDMSTPTSNFTPPNQNFMNQGVNQSMSQSVPNQVPNSVNPSSINPASSNQTVNNQIQQNPVNPS